MSETPIADSIRRIRLEELNAKAASPLAEIVLEGPKQSMPEHFDANGAPWDKNQTLIIATSFEAPYFSKDEGSV